MNRAWAVAVLAMFPAVVTADEELAKQLRAFSPPHFPDSKRDSFGEMVRDDLRRRFQEANRRSSEAWAKIETREQWEAFSRAKIAKLKQSLGSSLKSTGAVRSRTTGEIEGDGFRIQNLVFESRPGIWVTANLYLPEKPPESMPGIILCHSHHRPKEHGELQDMGMTWARNGCAVLVPDHLGHGERRQHPFVSAADYSKEFRVSRQDYYFRYDTAIQLHLAGESLIGWMAGDLIRGVDYLLGRADIDPEKIILLGAVAGGGDPAAVAAAIDDRIAAVVPFNFGGPQPETRFPLPDDVETTFNYAGSGGWESTRNLRRSAADGFLPWVIVGGIAPRRLVFAHEFNWDQPRDPVWKRLQQIYGFYGKPENLAFAHGKGELRGRPPEASHCTHIGKYHRRLIHPAFEKWFGIPVTAEDEFSEHREAEELHCLTPKVRSELKTKGLVDLLPGMADQQLAATRTERESNSMEERREILRRELAKVLGPVEAVGRPSVIGREWVRDQFPNHLGGERILLEVEPGIIVPVLLLYRLPGGIRVGPRKPRPVVIGVAQGGYEKFIRERSHEIAGLWSREMAVCLPDLRGCGETHEGGSRERRSADTGLSSSELMLRGTMVGARLRDLRSVIRYLETREEFDATRIAIWGDSFAVPNSEERRIRMPRGIGNRPNQSEPLGGFLALLGALYEPNVRAVYVNGGLGEFRSVLTNQFVLIPHDVVVPGLPTVADLPDIATALPKEQVRLGVLVDESNRKLPLDRIRELYPSAATAATEPFTDWLARILRESPE